MKFFLEKCTLLHGIGKENDVSLPFSMYNIREEKLYLDAF